MARKSYIIAVEGRSQIAGLFRSDNSRRRAACAHSLLDSALVRSASNLGITRAARFRDFFPSRASSRCARTALAATPGGRSPDHERFKPCAKSKMAARSSCRVSFFRGPPSLLWRSLARRPHFFVAIYHQLAGAGKNHWRFGRGACNRRDVLSRPNPGPLVAKRAYRHIDICYFLALFDCSLFESPAGNIDNRHVDLGFQFDRALPCPIC